MNKGGTNIIMVIYEYKLKGSNYQGCSFECDVLDGFTETLKTYKRKNGYPHMIRKEEIGKIKHSFDSVIYTTEENEKRAKKIFRKHVEREKSNLIDKYNRNLKIYNDQLTLLSGN